VWKKRNTNLLCPKGRGCGIMISDFLLPCERLIANPVPVEMHQEIGIPEYTSLLFEFGSQNNQGYWSTENIIKYIQNYAIKIFEVVYPGYRVLFLFNNASSHSSYADDALRVQNMNLHNGGEQGILQDSYFLNHRVHTIQYMVEKEGIPKGIEIVLQEQGLWKEGLQLKCAKAQCGGCQARKRYKNCQNQTGKLQQMVKARGHLVRFYPKFHCELNWIEYYWSQVKCYARDSCEYNYEGLKMVSSYQPSLLIILSY
ncbi:hypothetical protein C7212DRAFT_220536, partial [Tuber magnatum]